MTVAVLPPLAMASVGSAVRLAASFDRARSRLPRAFSSTQSQIPSSRLLAELLTSSSASVGALTGNDSPSKNFTT